VEVRRTIALISTVLGVHGKEDPIITHTAPPTAASTFQLDNVAGKRIVAMA
jgi:hypothetical protein